MAKLTKAERERQQNLDRALAAVRIVYYNSETPSQATIDLAEIDAQIRTFRKSLRTMPLQSTMPKEKA